MTWFLSLQVVTALILLFKCSTLHMSHQMAAFVYPSPPPESYDDLSTGQMGKCTGAQKFQDFLLVPWGCLLGAGESLLVLSRRTEKNEIRCVGWDGKRRQHFFALCRPHTQEQSSASSFSSWTHGKESFRGLALLLTNICCRPVWQSHILQFWQNLGRVVKIPSFFLSWNTKQF